MLICCRLGYEKMICGHSLGVVNSLRIYCIVLDVGWGYQAIYSNVFATSQLTLYNPFRTSTSLSLYANNFAEMEIYISLLLGFSCSLDITPTSSIQQFHHGQRWVLWHSLYPYHLFKRAIPTLNVTVVIIKRIITPA